MKYLFYISNQGVSVYEDRNKTAEMVRSFYWSDLNQVDTFLAELPPKSPVSIILDLVEEDISIDAFPKLFLWEKNSVRNQHILHRKEDGAEFVHTQWTGESVTNADGRIEELLLTSAITSPPQLVNFMEALEEAQVMLSGLYSAPFLLASYFKDELSQDFGFTKAELNQPFFLISRQSDLSYRQTFFNKSSIRISRLIELDKVSDDYEGLKSALVHETKLAKNYVYNQNIIDGEEDISYVFIDGDQKCLDGLEELSLESGLIQETSDESSSFFRTLDFDQELKVRSESGGHNNFAQIGLSDFVFRQNPVSFYGTPYVTKINNLLLGSRSLITVNSLFFLALLIYITISTVDWFIANDRLERLDQSIANHQIEKERLQKVVKLQVDAEEIKASVEFSEAILNLKTDRTLGFNIKPISQVVANQANIQVMELDWKKQGKFDSNIYVVDFIGLVYPFDGYYHDPVLWVDNFKDELATISNVTNVQIVKEPLNRDLKQALTIVVNEKSQTVDALPFQIKIQVSHESK